MTPEDLPQRDGIERAAKGPAECDEPFQLRRALTLQLGLGLEARGERARLKTLSILMKREGARENHEAGNQVDVVAQLDVVRGVDDETQGLAEHDERAGHERDGER